MNESADIRDPVCGQPVDPLRARAVGIFGGTTDEILRHPVSLIGTPEEIIDELKRREQTHGLSMLVMTFTTLDQMRAFADRVIARV